jgi:hypothetical protein
LVKREKIISQQVADKDRIARSIFYPGWPTSRRHSRREHAYAGTVEDDVYSALSERFSDIFAVLGQLPDSFEDAWVEAVLKDREAVRYFPQRIETISSPMEKRYWNDVADDAGLDWESTEKVLSAHDIEAHMRRRWR